MYLLVLLITVAFLASLALTPAVRNIALRWNIVDYPGERKIHQYPMPCIGGVAVALACFAAYGALFVADYWGGQLHSIGRAEIWRLLPAATTIFVVGLLDDVRGLSAWQKLVGQLAAAGIAYWGGVHITGFGGRIFANWWSLPATVSWLLLCTNAVNLIDGVDGLAAGAGFFATTTTLLAALMQGNVELALAAGTLAAALLGFLRFNFNPATIFLGDCGSLFIGFLLGCYSILGSQKSATILGMTAPLVALAVPLLDTSLAIARRLLRNRPIFAADRAHIHHRLLDRGFNPRHVVLLLYAFCALASIVSLLMTNNSNAGLAIILFCIVAWIGIKHLAYVEFGVACHMLINGDFRRQVNAQLAIKALEKSLADAATPDECWIMIREACSEFGFRQVRLALAGRFFQQDSGVELERCWHLRIFLSGDDFLEVAREFGTLNYSTAVTPLAETLRRSLTSKFPAFESVPKYFVASSAAK